MTKSVTCSYTTGADACTPWTLSFLKLEENIMSKEDEDEAWSPHHHHHHGRRPNKKKSAHTSADEPATRTAVDPAAALKALELTPEKIREDFAFCAQLASVGECHSEENRRWRRCFRLFRF